MYHEIVNHYVADIFGIVTDPTFLHERFSRNERSHVGEKAGKHSELQRSERHGAILTFNHSAIWLESQHQAFVRMPEAFQVIVTLSPSAKVTAASLSMMKMI